MNSSTETPSHEYPKNISFFNRPKNPSHAELSGELPFLTSIVLVLRHLFVQSIQASGSVHLDHCGLLGVHHLSATLLQDQALC